MGDATSKRAFIAAAGTSPRAHTFAATVWDARRRLAVNPVAFTYQRGGDVSDRPDGSTSARVDVGAVPVRFRLVPRRKAFDVVAASAIGRRRLPLWLAGRIRVDRNGPVTATSVDGGIPGFDASASARRAVVSVRSIVPGAGDLLTVIAPRKASTTAAILGRKPSSIARVAAITTRVDGQPTIVLNPPLFGSMDDRARQVVMTHEATHVLSGVVGHMVDAWVAEGFADYVALHDDHAPLAVSAGQALSGVRKHGAPKSLPSDRDFDESTHGLNAVYESAWMVFRMLGHDFGDAAVVGFYRDVVSGQQTEVAAQRRFGMTIAQITDAWRAYLTKSASTVS